MRLTYGVESPDERKKKGKDAEGTVQVRARRNRDYVSVIVEDDGAGLMLIVSVRKQSIVTCSPEQANQLPMNSALNCYSARILHSRMKSRRLLAGVGMDVVYTTIQAVDGEHRSA